MLKLCITWNEGKFEKYIECAYIETENINSTELSLNAHIYTNTYQSV